MLGTIANEISRKERGMKSKTEFYQAFFETLEKK